MRIATTEEIESRSSGQVRTPETINYRTFKPEAGGLWCARIFGPTEDNACLCGKLVGAAHRGATCAKCEVVVGSKDVRATRFGHIELATTVLHPFAYGPRRDHVAALLDLSPEDVDALAAWTHARVSDPGATRFSVGTVLDAAAVDDTLMEYGELVGHCFGVEAIAEALGDRSEAVLLRRIPVLPPDLRPMIQLGEGRFQTHPTTDLYRRVVNRSARLRRLKELQAPVTTVRAEAGMLQEAVNALFDNGYHGKPIVGEEAQRLTCLRDGYEAEHGALDDDVLSGDDVASSVWTFALALVP